VGERESSRSTGQGVEETGCRDPREARQSSVQLAAHAASHDVGVELGPDDRGDIEDREVGVRQERVPTGEDGVQRRGRSPTAAGDFDDEQGVPTGVDGDGRGVSGGSLAGEQVGDISRRQPAEVDAVDRSHPREITQQHAQSVIEVGCAVAGGDQHQDRGVDRRPARWRTVARVVAVAKWRSSMMSSSGASSAARRR
jgi:hypothetical protein